MGRILSFTPRDAAGGQPARTPATAAAVIIFPGVRYEREKDGDARENGDGAPDPTPILPGLTPRH